MSYIRYLTNEGIQYLRDYLHLPPEIVPPTLKRQTKPAGDGKLIYSIVNCIQNSNWYNFQADQNVCHVELKTSPVSRADEVVTAKVRQATDDVTLAAKVCVSKTID